MEQRIWREVNWPLFGCVLALLAISLLSVYSAVMNAVTADGAPLSVLFPRHALNIAVGLAVMLAAMTFDYRLLSSLSRPLYIVVIIVLVLVLLIGKISEGAQSWLVVGTRTFQPSEFAKPLLIIVLAAYWSRFEGHAGSWRVQMGGLLLASAPMALVLAQPDFGTVVVYASIWFTMAWGAGLRWQQLLALALLALPLILVGWLRVLDDEQKSRMLTFYWMLTDPSRVDPNEGYNIQQSLTAIGAGGIFGAGLTRGLLSQGNYVPVQYSDFIFAVIGEEMGFLGGVVLLTFQAVLLWLALSIAERARDVFGRLIALGIFGMLLCHTLVNVGMAMGMMPVTGLPLPFISYGGSFMITSLAAVGILQNIAMHWRRIAF